MNPSRIRSVARIAGTAIGAAGIWFGFLAVSAAMRWARDPQRWAEAFPIAMFAALALASLLVTLRVWLRWSRPTLESLIGTAFFLVFLGFIVAVATATRPFLAAIAFFGGGIIALALHRAVTARLCRAAFGAE